MTEQHNFEINTLQLLYLHKRLIELRLFTKMRCCFALFSIAFLYLTKITTLWCNLQNLWKRIGDGFENRSSDSWQ